MNGPIKEVKFGVTKEHKCSYLRGKEARNLFLDPAMTPDEETVRMLTHAGFRRSGNHLFKPFCPDCQACVPVRLRVCEFQARRRHRRILQRNQDLDVRLESPAYRDDWYQLYERYIRARHPSSEMAPSSPARFNDFLLSRWSKSLFLCSYLEDRIMSIAVTDVIGDSSSAVYTFYDARESRRSLGIFSILAQIAVSRICGKKHLYLGYWIDGHAKMQYKLEFSPCEVLRSEGRWVECASRGRILSRTGEASAREAWPRPYLCTSAHDLVD